MEKSKKDLLDEAEFSLANPTTWKVASLA